ncbi:MAG TPA: hypothetical protein VF746_21660 [Longimicrobium sp.]|jgi:hypothetical protein
MRRTPLAALLALAAGCASGGAGGGTGPAPGGTDSRVTVLVENSTTDQLRVTGRGATSLRLQPGQSGCLRVSPSGGQITLLAEPLGGGENRLGYGGSGNAAAGGTDNIRSREFSPTEATAWSWKIGRNALNGNQLQPAAQPCG